MTIVLHNGVRIGLFSESDRGRDQLRRFMEKAPIGAQVVRDGKVLSEREAFHPGGLSTIPSGSPYRMPNILTTAQETCSPYAA